MVQNVLVVMIVGDLVLVWDDVGAVVGYMLDASPFLVRSRHIVVLLCL